MRTFELLVSVVIAALCFAGYSYYTTLGGSSQRALSPFLQHDVEITYLVQQLRELRLRLFDLESQRNMSEFVWMWLCFSATILATLVLLTLFTIAIFCIVKRSGTKKRRGAKQKQAGSRRPSLAQLSAYGTGNMGNDGMISYTSHVARHDLGDSVDTASIASSYDSDFDVIWSSSDRDDE